MTTVEKKTTTADKKACKENKKLVKYATITRAELAGGYFNKHVTFVIKTPKGNIIKRRYGDFEWLRFKLKQFLPGAFIPPIPPKLPVAMWPTGYLLMRKRELQQFLHRLEIIPYLKNEYITEYFLLPHDLPFDKVRKQWEKENPKLSYKKIYEKLVEIFPNINDAEYPLNIIERCKESKLMINISIKELDKMIVNAQNFIQHQKESISTMNDFCQSFDKLMQIECQAQTKSVAKEVEFCNQKRIDISSHVGQWKTFKGEECLHIQQFFIPTLNRAVNDLHVIAEIIKTRERYQYEYKCAKEIALKWHSNVENLRSSQIASKHRDLEKESDLKNISMFIEKLVLGQLNVVFCANCRRWKKSTMNFTSAHLLSLEKVLGSWKSLINKALESRGEIDAMFVALTIESLPDSTSDESEIKENDDADDEEEFIEVIDDECGFGQKELNAKSVENNICDEKNRENLKKENDGRDEIGKEVDDENDDESVDEVKEEIVFSKGDIVSVEKEETVEELVQKEKEAEAEIARVKKQLENQEKMAALFKDEEDNENAQSSDNLWE